MSDSDLRQLISRPGSYSSIASAAAGSRLGKFPVKLFEHIGEVYRRVETAADKDYAEIIALRLTALVHEESPESLPKLLDTAGLSDVAPTVLAVMRAFGRIWKIGSDEQLRAYVAENQLRLASILLFEVAHEGQLTALMERAAVIGGLHSHLKLSTARLSGLRLSDRC